jgi:hypothetical protein
MVAQQQRTPAIRTVLCQSPLAAGHTISAVEFRDGRFGIFVDQDLSGDGVWDASQLKPCIDAFMALKWQLLHARRV